MKLPHRQLRFLVTATLLAIGIASCHSANCPSACGQTLSEKLIAENATQLAKEARKKGDIVRGAILFHQGNINCARCHRPAAGENRIAPDLGKIDAAVTDEKIIESILQPSKEIKDEYKTTIVLTSDGLVIVGTKVVDNDDKIVLRSAADVEKLITIDRDDIEEIQAGTESSMPKDLANEMKNRQQFLDLLRYVYDLKERGSEEQATVSQTENRRTLDAKLEGLLLIQQRNCVACHDANTDSWPIAAKQAPHLQWSAARLNPAYIESFIANPHTVKPGTTMPALLERLEGPNRKATAAAITQFLLSTSKSKFKAEPIDGEAVHRGYALFHSAGCVACHSPRDESALEKNLTNSKPLGDLSGKYNISGLAELLEDPLAVRPSGHMPDMQLTHREAVDIANYLLQSSPDKIDDYRLKPESARFGKILFTKLNCANCHAGMSDLAGIKPGGPAIAASLDKLDPAKGCLSGQPGNWPNFELTDQQQKLMQGTLKSLPTEFTPTEKIESTLVNFNCIACHSRGDLGGITVDRNPYFKTEDLNLGEQGRIPPSLTGVGAKLKLKWMEDVLYNGRSVRPYMNTRMPKFGEANVDHLPKLLAASDRLAETKFATFADQKAMRLKGHVLAGGKGLNCVACHTYQFKTSDTMPAVDLTEMAERLEKDWFYQYMLAPQKFSPNTVMPSFWPGGKAIRADIEGTPADQVEALWQYLIDGRQARAPVGVVREPLQIVVSDEAKILRRRYPGIGKRGIGVGYPGGVNITFDAEQMRLAHLWRGEFVEASGVWRRQGSGEVRFLTKPIPFPKGPDLDDAKSPWQVDDGRPPQHQFKGYDLDKQRRPKFRYQFDSVDVEDFFSQTDDGGGKTLLRRTITLSSEKARQGLRFRVGSGKKIQQADGVISIGEKLKIRILSDHKAQIESSDEELQTAKIRLDVEPGQKQELQLEYIW